MGNALKFKRAPHFLDGKPAHTSLPNAPYGVAATVERVRTCSAAGGKPEMRQRLHLSYGLRKGHAGTPGSKARTRSNGRAT